MFSILYPHKYIALVFVDYISICILLLYYVENIAA